MTRSEDPAWDRQAPEGDLFRINDDEVVTSREAPRLSTNLEPAMASLPSLPLPPPVARRPIRIPWRKAVLPGALFLLGLILGVGAVLLYALTIAGEGKPLLTPATPPGGDIVVQVGPAYLTHIVRMNIQSAGLPGTVKNVTSQLKHGDQMIVSGDDTFVSFFGIQLTRHFTLTLQPYVRQCQLQMHVLHADMNGIPVTSFASSFEGKLNKQLEVKPTGLPSGFAYCTVDVHTETRGLFITYSAKALALRARSLLA